MILPRGSKRLRAQPEFTSVVQQSSISTVASSLRDILGGVLHYLRSICTKGKPMPNHVNAKPAIHELNVSKLMKLRAKVAVIAEEIDEIIFHNERSAIKSRLHRMIETSAAAEGGGVRISVASEVRQLLQLAGGQGTTSEEIVHLISRKMPVKPNTVRSALRRQRDFGHAQNIGRRWYSKV